MESMISTPQKVKTPMDFASKATSMDIQFQFQMIQIIITFIETAINL
jgi:hypothetical protein